MNPLQKTLYLKALLALATAPSPATKKRPTPPRKGPTMAVSSSLAADIRLIKVKTA